MNKAFRLTVYLWTVDCWLETLSTDRDANFLTPLCVIIFTQEGSIEYVLQETVCPLLLKLLYVAVITAVKCLDLVYF